MCLKWIGSFLGEALLPFFSAHFQQLIEKVICLRKSEVSVERISVCNVDENLAKHGIHCQPCSYTNGVTDMSP